MSPQVQGLLAKLDNTGVKWWGFSLGTCLILSVGLSLAVLFGFVLYDADGAFAHLRESVNPQKAVNKQRLDKFLIAKREGHFRNITFLLARLLNEIYMGAMVGIIRGLIEKKGTIDMDFSYKAAQWKEMRNMNFNDNLKNVEQNSTSVCSFKDKIRILKILYMIKLNLFLEK